MDAYRQGFDAAQQKPRRVRVHVAPQRGASGVNGLHQVLPAGDDSADKIGMTSEVLRARVHDEVNAMLRRTAVNRRGEGAVNERDKPVLLGERGNPLEVDDAQGWIRG